MGIGITELLLILLVVLIFFGAGKLPNVMGELGKGVQAFRKGLSGEEGGAASSSDKAEGKKSAKK